MTGPKTRDISNTVSVAMLPRIVSVVAEPKTASVLATFANGELRRFDVTPLLSRGVFQRLQSEKAFAAVHVDEMGGIEWEAGPDLSRDTIYLDGMPI